MGRRSRLSRTSAGTRDTTPGSSSTRTASPPTRKETSSSARSTTGSATTSTRSRGWDPHLQFSRRDPPMLIKKLHLKPGMRFIAVNAPQGFHRALEPLPEGATEERALRGTFDLILLFVSSKNELKSQWTKALSSLKPDG